MENYKYGGLTQEEQRMMALLDDKPIAYKPVLAKTFKSVQTAILLSQYLYWSRMRTTVAHDGWFFKTEEDMYEETGLTPKQQRNARETLFEHRVLAVKKEGMPARNWYKIDHKQLLACVHDYAPKPKEINDGAVEMTTHPQRALQELPFGDYKNSPKGTTRAPQRALHSLEENTEENTEENIKGFPVKQAKSAILTHWNLKDIIVHRTLSRDADKELDKLVHCDADVQAITAAIDVYATVLKGDGYWWSHKWNLYEFLKRGLKQFEGKTPDDYQKTPQGAGYRKPAEVVQV